MPSAYQGPRANPRYNVIEILLDDVGCDALSCYDSYNQWSSYDYPVTPNIDLLVGAGVMFTNCWAHPVCSPDRAASLTGKYPIITTEHPNGTGIGSTLDLDDPNPLTTSMLAMPLAFAAEGAQTPQYHVGKWHLGDGQDAGVLLTSAGNPVGAAGVTEYRGCLTNMNKNYSNGATSYVGDYTDYTYTVCTSASSSQTPHTTTHVLTTELTDVLDLLPADASPFVIRWWTHLPHTPFNVVPNSLLDAGASMYNDGSDPQEESATTNPYNDHNVVWRRVKAGIEALDNAIGTLLAALSTAQRENTIIILRSDNGTDSTVLTSVGSPAEPPSGVYDPDHAKVTMYEQGISVPLIIAPHPSAVSPGWLGAGMGGTVSAALCSTVDIFQTIADYTLAASIKYQTDGVSLRHVLAGEATQARRYAFSFRFLPNGAAWDDVASGSGYAAVRDQAGNKLIRRNDGTDELYDLSTDPTELTPLTLSGSTYDALSAELVALGVPAP
jgi:arylsulfatase B